MRFYKMMLWKAYLDKGLGLMNYVTKVFMVIGIGAGFQGTSLATIAGLAVIYSVACLVIGRLWFYFKLIDAEIEVQNKVNPFVTEMRKVYKPVVPK